MDWPYAAMRQDVQSAPDLRGSNDYSLVMANLCWGTPIVSMTLTKPPRSARKAKGDGHLRRAEILQAAELIFVRDGYQGATIRKIAEEVGVSSTALYMHF